VTINRPRAVASGPAGTGSEESIFFEQNAAPMWIVDPARDRCSAAGMSDRQLSGISKAAAGPL
jgi:hypothetical protein